MRGVKVTIVHRFWLAARLTIIMNLFSWRGVFICIIICIIYTIDIINTTVLSAQYFCEKIFFQNYIANGSSMYVTMLDASKAFDKVNHSKLFGKLIDRGCPAFIVRILYHWYGTQQFTIRWCQGFSSFFTVSNGIKQGGILSPPSFQCVNLNKLQIGCLYAGTLINHLMYADDLCIFSPSVAGLRKLTDCCAKYGELFNITYIAKQTPGHETFSLYSSQ